MNKRYMLSHSNRNIIEILICIAAVAAGVWLAYYFTYTYPLLILPGIVLVLAGSVYSSFLIGTAIWKRTLSFSRSSIEEFLNTSSYVATFTMLLLLSLLFGSQGIYYKAIADFDSKDLSKYGKETTGFVYDYSMSGSKGPRHRNVHYYYKLSDRNYSGKYPSSTLEVGDTIKVIYSTHIPEINRVIE